MTSTLITASIPYVNAEPHLGYAYELVQADIAARALRRDGSVRSTAGTDDNSLKNVLAAEAAGDDVAAFVDRHAERFVTLGTVLDLSLDDVVRTSRDERHARAVHEIWRAADRAGDLYRREYEGRYCVGCEQYYAPGELTDGRCPEHGTEPDIVAETNWFFRLSRYQQAIDDLISCEHIRIRPEPFRREVLAFVRGGLDDISVSRSAERARGWGISVPGDPGQVIYVWFDALTNYLSTLGWAGAGDPGWRRLDRRIHVIGKGILRFHAVYWPAFLLAAGEPPPTDLRVHPYLTIDGRKISKSGGATVDPFSTVALVGADALRWYLARDIADVADTDVTVRRIVDRANDELANGLANATHRVVTLIHRHLGGVVDDELSREPDEHIAELCADADGLLVELEVRSAADRVASAIATLNAEISRTAPWQIARDPDRRDELAAVLGRQLAGIRRIATCLAPFCPSLSGRLTHQVSGSRLPPTEPTFRRIEI